MFEVTISDESAAALGLDDTHSNGSLELAKAAWEKYHDRTGAECLYTHLCGVLRELSDNLSEDTDQHYRNLFEPVTEYTDIAISFGVLGESYYEQARDRVRKHRADLAELAVGLQAIYLEEKYRGRFESRGILQNAEKLMDAATELLSRPGLAGGSISRVALTDLHIATAKLNSGARLATGERVDMEISRMMTLNRITEARVAVAIVLALVTRALYWFDEWHDGE